MNKIVNICFVALILIFIFPGTIISQEGADRIGNEESYTLRLQEYRLVLSETYIPNTEDIDGLKRLLDELAETAFIERTTEARMLLAIAEDKYTALERSLEDADSLFIQPNYPVFRDDVIGSNRNLGLGITLGTSLTSLALFNVFSYMSNIAYERYVTTTSTRNALVLQQAWMMYDLLGYIFLGAGAVAFGTAFPFFFITATAPPETGIDPAALIAQHDKMYNRLKQGEENKNGWRIVRGIGLGTGITALIGTGLFFGLAESMYYRYNQEFSSSDGDFDNGYDNLFSTIGLGAGITAAAALLTAALGAVLPADTERLENEINKIDVELTIHDEDGDDTKRREYLLQRIAELEELRDEYQNRLEYARQSRKALNIVTFTSLGVGIASLIGTGVSIYLGIDQLNDFNDRQDTSYSQSIDDQLRSTDIAAYISGIVGTLALGTSLITICVRPKEKRLMEEIDHINARIKGYRGQLNLF